MEQKKVKAVWWKDPSRTREFTQTAFDYVKSDQGWVLALDQSSPVAEKKTNPAAAPAALANHNATELKKAQDEYTKVTGKQPDPAWNELRLFAETQKAIKTGAVKKEIEEVEVDTEEIREEEKAVEAPKRKYTKKAKPETEAA